MAKPLAEGPPQLKNTSSWVLWPANLAAEPVVNSVGTKNHGICAGKWYGRASEEVMDMQF